MFWIILWIVVGFVPALAFVALLPGAWKQAYSGCSHDTCGRT
jgi:hypothetical protein